MSFQNDQNDRAIVPREDPTEVDLGVSATDERYVNLELSWLLFNERVLQEAVSASVPLLERIRFLAISSSKLDEFFRVRVASLVAGRADETVAVLERATRLDPLDLPVLDYLGKAHLTCGHYDQTQAQFDRVLELDPEFRSALEGKGWTHLQMGRLDDAIDTFERVRELTPHPKGGITPLAYALGVAGRLAEAEELVALIEEHEQEDPDVALDLDLATIFSGMGREEQALDRLRQAADKRIGGIVFLRNWPLWASLRQVSVVEEFMKEQGL